METIRAAEIQPGMVVIDGRRRIPVVKVEPGESCRGIHLNVTRLPSHVKRGDKWVPNPRGGQMTHNDGCYDPAMSVEIEARS